MTPIQQFRALKERFDQAHEEGMAALKAGDLARLQRAIKDEQSITEEQSRPVAEQQAKVRELTVLAAQAMPLPNDKEP